MKINKGLASLRYCKNYLYVHNKELLLKQNTKTNLKEIYLLVVLDKNYILLIS